MPRPVFMELWRRYENNARLNLERTRELLRILGLFHAHSILALPYKGPALAQMLYGNVALREFEDLDVLVRFDDVLRAKALLVAEGYEPDYPLSPEVEDAFLHSRYQYHRVLVHPATGAQIELHWKTDPGFPIEESDDDSWWATRPTMPLLDGTVRCFSRDELLLILSLHGTRHQGYRLGWLVEIAALMAAGDLDWRLILETARTKACARRLVVPLHLVQTLLGAKLPPEVDRIIAADRNITELSSRIAARLFARNTPELRALERLRVSLQFYDRPKQRLDHVLDVSLAPSLNEWSRWPLPRALFGLYLPLRLWRLAGKYGSALLGRN
jgi:hypothetical protein